MKLSPLHSKNILENHFGVGVDTENYEVIEAYEFYDLVFNIVDKNKEILLDVPSSVYCDFSGLNEIVWDALKDYASRGLKTMVTDTIVELIEEYINWETILESIYDVYKEEEIFKSLSHWIETNYEKKIYFIQKIV